MAEQQTLFFVTVAEVFGFLVREHGFAPALDVSPPRKPYEKVAFVGKQVAVECVYEEREEVVECHVSRLERGRLPDVYELDERGRLVRVRLSVLANRLGTPLGTMFRRTRGLPRERAMRQTLEDYAVVLKSHCRSVLEDRWEELPPRRAGGAL